MIYNSRILRNWNFYRNLHQQRLSNQEYPAAIYICDSLIGTLEKCKCIITTGTNVKSGISQCKAVHFRRIFYDLKKDAIKKFLSRFST